MSPTTFSIQSHKCFSNNNISCEKVFGKVISDLQYLSETGVTVELNGIVEQVYFDCILVVGDNLGLNGCCGFQESFNGGNYCRICRASHTQYTKLKVEFPKLFRSRQNYELDLRDHTRGVKEECIFNQLPNFHIVENKTVDLMHDIFEGVARDTIEKVLTSLIFRENLFSLDDLNHRLENFDFGDVEKSNKPKYLLIEKCSARQTDILNSSVKVRAKQSAAEMACFSRYLGLIIGDLIPGQNKYWTLYIILRKIIGLVTSPQY